MNFEEYERKKIELQEIRHTKMEGAKVKSRAKWLNEGKETTNYFCNLENRNFMSKTVNCLLSTAGNVLKSHSEVLKEVELFYRNLYFYREVDQVNLGDILHNGNHKKLNDNMKESIEGNITYDEVLSSLKKMSNNKSPGYDGFTVEFFKFFWNDLGHF